ncbi:hypothetical protein [Streptomyces sp. NPDC058045]|uniref:hypothetical protein n=1 Tax=Streptomyces sp. NPDC058045 TaxID=3346311 RepID=UPI0036E4848E
MSQPIQTPGRELTQRPATVSRVPHPSPPSLDEYLRMAWNGLSATTPAARRVEATESGRDLLAWLIGLPLDEMDTDALVYALLHLRAGLARMVVATIPTAVAPAPESGPALNDADLVSHLMDLISDAAPLHADVAVHVAQPLPADLITSLARAINAPGLRPTGTYLEAIGFCGSSTIHLTAQTAGGA